MLKPCLAAVAAKKQVKNILSTLFIEVLEIVLENSTTAIKIEWPRYPYLLLLWNSLHVSIHNVVSFSDGWTRLRCWSPLCLSFLLHALHLRCFRSLSLNNVEADSEPLLRGSCNHASTSWLHHLLHRLCFGFLAVLPVVVAVTSQVWIRGVTSGL